MRLMQGPWPASAPVADAAPASTLQATGGDTVALKDGSVLVGTIAPATLAFQTSFGEAQVPTDKIVEYKDGTLTLADGSTLKGSFAEPILGTAKLEIATAAGALSVPLAEVIGIQRTGTFAAAAPAQPPPQAITLPGPGQGLLTGKVLDNFAKPIVGVTIKTRNSQFTGASDTSGTYSLPYVPGKVVLGYQQSDHYPVELSLDIASAAVYPISDIVMYRRPQGVGLFLAGTSGYESINTCLVEYHDKPVEQSQTSSTGPFDPIVVMDEGHDFILLARGIPTLIISGPDVHLVNTIGSPMALYAADAGRA